MFPAERERGVYDVDPHTPSTHHRRTRPATSTSDNELIVGLQTDAPLKRAIMPNGGWRMVEDALRDLRLRARPDASRRSSPSTARRTTQGVFDVYPPHVRAARRSHIITGLPDAYGRGRIIGDYRRVALYGVDALIAAKKVERAATGPAALRRGRDPRPRGERRADPRARRAQGDGRQLRLRHLRPGGDRAARPCSGCTSPTWRAVKEQNGAAMSLGRTSTFLDVYLAARPRRGPDHRDAGAGADRRPGDQAAHRAVPAHPGVRRAVLRRPDLGHRVDRRHGRGRPPAGHPDVVPDAADAVQPGPRPGTEPHRAVERRAARRRSSSSARRSRSTRSAIQYESDELIRDAVGRRRGDRLLRVGDAGRQADAVLRRPRQPREDAAVRDQRRAGRGHRRAGRPAARRRSSGDVLDYDDVRQRSTRLLDWLAETYVDALNCVHYMHDKYAYERLEMALHDAHDPAHAGLRHRRPVAWSPTRCPRSSTPRSARCATTTGWSSTISIDGEFPTYGNDDDRADDIAVGIVRAFMEKIRRQPTYRDAVHTQSVLTITSNVVYGKATGNTPDGRRAGAAVRARRQPDERPGHPRHAGQRAERREAALRRVAGRDLADRDGDPGGSGPHPGGAGREPGRPAGRLHRSRTAST